MFHVKHQIEMTTIKPAGIAKRFRQEDIPLTARQAEQFALYHAEILRWNPKANLISKNDELRILERHFLESAVLSRLDSVAQILQHEDEEKHDSGLSSHQPVVMDLGTGGGFPGVPIKILCPDLKMTLIDSKRWKALFLKDLIKKLNLTETEVMCERVEQLQLQRQYRQHYRLIICRAVAPLVKLYKWAKPLLLENGELIAVKGSNLKEELGDFRKKNPFAEMRIDPFPGSWPECGKLKIVTINRGSNRQ